MISIPFWDFLFLSLGVRLISIPIDKLKVQFPSGIFSFFLDRLEEKLIEALIEHFNSLLGFSLSF